MGQDTLCNRSHAPVPELYRAKAETMWTGEQGGGRKEMEGREEESARLFLFLIPVGQVVGQEAGPLWGFSILGLTGETVRQI